MTLSERSENKPVGKERVVFWLGCHVLRHSDIIRSCMAVLERLGVDALPVGGARYCCGTIKDMNIAAAQTLGERTTNRFNEFGRDTVISYCPSCQVHLDNFMSETNETEFDFGHFVKFLHQKQEHLAGLLTKPIVKRVALHMHSGFQQRASINQMTLDLLNLIPGLEVIQHDVLAPGVHCTGAFVAIPGVNRDMLEGMLCLRHEHAVDAVVTIFHSCQRQLCALEAGHPVNVVNFVSLLATSMGVAEQTDLYKAWKNAGDEAAIRCRRGRSGGSGR